jgi:hypothetical protein
VALPKTAARRAALRRLPPLWLAALILAIGIPNLAAAVATVRTLVTEGYAFDWTNFVRAADRFPDPTLYEFAGPYAFRYSPLAALAFGAIAPLGLTLWRIAHFAALGALRDWRLIGLALLSYPFWFDVETGNLVTFVAVSGVLALRGSRLATGIYLLLFLLVPRPLALPLTVWILWRSPGWRIPFAITFFGQLAAVVWLQLLTPWLTALLGSSSELHADLNLGPSAVVGIWWLLVAAPLAAWFTWRGRLGLASVLASPYWLPYYFLMLLLELAPRRRASRSER